MIKNTHQAVKDYAEALKQAQTVHRQAVAHIKANYVEGSELYKSAMQTAKTTLTNATTQMKDLCVQKVKKDFEDVRTAVRKAVAVTPSAELLGILPLIKDGKMKEAELQMFLESFKGNYMDMKLLKDAMNEPFTTVENVVEELNRLEASVTEYFDTYAGESMESISYRNAMMLNGSQIDAVDSLTDSFLSLYAGKED